MASLSQVVINTANEQKSQQNQRKHTVVRTCGEEHTGHSDAGTATVYLPTDPEMEYIAQLRFKLILGEPLGENKPITSPAGTGFPVGKTHSPFNTWQEFRDYFIHDDHNSAVDMDGFAGYQCYDLADFFWVSNCGRTLQTGNGLAYGCWTLARDVNAGTEFSLITNWNDVKAGDWCVWAANQGVIGDAGHINMALEDVASHPHPQMLGQNQQNANADYGHFTTVDNYFDGTGFLGAFRYRYWRDYSHIT